VELRPNKGLPAGFDSSDVRKVSLAGEISQRQAAVDSTEPGSFDSNEDEDMAMWIWNAARISQPGNLQKKVAFKLEHTGSFLNLDP
jgi:hypothetical protein